MSFSQNTHRFLLLASVLALGACANVRLTEGVDFVKPDTAKPAVAKAESEKSAPASSQGATASPITRSAASTVSMAPLAPMTAATTATTATAASAAKPAAPKVTARAATRLKSTSGNSAYGVVSFTQTSDSVRIFGVVRGLKPDTEHGFHMHEKGSCASPDGMSAGGHFNPGKQPHGKHAAAAHHAGDLPNLKADAKGVATFDFTFRSTDLSIGAGANDILGRSLIVHRDADDFSTQPSGNAGARIACGVIGIG